MSHTHLLYHIIFATKDRMPMIAESWEAELHKYIAGIIKNLEGEPIEINGNEEHVHIFLRLKPSIALSELLRDVKAGSSKWAKRHQPKFSWQRRYGAFSVSESVSTKLRKYIREQKEHHKKFSFQDEYKQLLSKHSIQFDEKYLWE